MKFNDFQYLALADHIDFALSRIEDNIDISAANTRWEVKNLFPKEYKISEKVIALINKEVKVNLPVSESIFMTYHFVNAASDNDQVQETVEITELISGIIDIIQYQYQMTLDTESFNYSRFITHLRVLLVRLLRNKHHKSGKLDGSLLGFMKIKYKFFSFWVAWFYYWEERAMAKNYDGLAKTIIKDVGGKDNVISVVHCTTRLRFKLKDEKKANDDVLKDTDGVVTVVKAGGQYQKYV